MTTSFHEIKTDYIDDDNLLHIDGYLTADQNEQGFTIAVVDLDTHKTVFFKNEYRHTQQVTQAIENAKLDRIHKQNQEKAQAYSLLIENEIEPYFIGTPDEPQINRVRKLCPTCSSENIYCENNSSWSIDTQQCELNDPYSSTAICNECGKTNIDATELSLDCSCIDINDEQWKVLFKPSKNTLDKNASWDGLMYETYGDEQ